ncbi:uncharacterized protein LOC135128721 [Zophobas morio]|uniref:uncharacterized protein LOC135128721 n=1 Tax=Zophobas morio TaxID=2755281 RepID=UPI003083EBA9
MIERLSELMNDVWTGKGFPREWRVGQICPIHKKEKELLKEGGRVYALFVDLRVAFDTVDRECLWECMERRRLSEKLIAAAREIYRKTVTSVRVGGIESEMFWTTKGLRQGCPLSPSLFVCYISNIEEMFRGVQAGGIVVGREKRKKGQSNIDNGNGVEYR